MLSDRPCVELWLPVSPLSAFAVATSSESLSIARDFGACHFLFLSSFLLRLSLAEGQVRA